MSSVSMPATLSNYMLSSAIEEALKKTRSSFLPQSMVTGKHGRSLLGRVHIVLVAFLISIFVLVRVGVYAPIVWEALFILFGLLFILVGWLEFSLLEEIEIIPTSKIEATAEGVNEINAQFVPEKGDCLISPLTKQKCVSYIISLQELVSSGKSSHWEQRAYFNDGIPSLMTDGTGYLAMDLESADMSLKGTDHYPVNDKNQLVRSGTPEGENLLTAVETGDSKTDLSKLGVAFDTNPNVGVSFSLFSGYEMKLVETVIPTGTDYFVMGRISGTESELNGKPVKLMTYDSHTKILSVRNEGKGNIEMHDKLLTFCSLGLGFLVLLAGVGLFAVTSANPTLWQYALTTTIKTPYTGIPYYTTIAPTTTIALSSVQMPGQKPNSVALFNGNDSHIVLPENSLNINNFTVSVFINAIGPIGNPDIFSVGPGASDGGFQVGVDSFNEPFVGLSTQDGYSYYDSSIPVPLSKWMHLAVTYNGTALTFYADGVKYYPFSLSGVHLHPLSWGCIGAWECTYQSWQGTMSDLQVYNTSLTSGQILALYQQGMTGGPLSRSGLVGWWPLNGTSKDYSGNHNDGVDTNVVYKLFATNSTIKYTPNNIFHVSVTASDHYDSFPRDWHLFIDVYPGTYTGYGNMYSNASTYTYYGGSGSTMTYSSYDFNSTNDPGTHTIYFVIGQSGGGSYGTYSGTMLIDNYSTQFSGVDACYALKVTYNLNHGGILDSSFIYLC